MRRMQRKRKRISSVRSRLHVSNRQNPGNSAPPWASPSGEPQQARELLAPVYGWFTDGFDTRDLKEVTLPPTFIQWQLAERRL
jgi:hypothetical protein